MTAAELIAALQAFDDETRVVMSGYEGGFKDIGGCGEIELALGVNHARYYGPHEESGHYAVRPEHSIEDAVVIY